MKHENVKQLKWIKILLFFSKSGSFISLHDQYLFGNVYQHNVKCWNASSDYLSVRTHASTPCHPHVLSYVRLIVSLHTKESVSSHLKDVWILIIALLANYLEETPNKNNPSVSGNRRGVGDVNKQRYVL